MAMKRIAAMLLTSVLLLSCVGCTQDGRKELGAEKADLGLTAEVKPATDFTAKANAAVYDELDFDDKQEYEFATRGLIDAPETLELRAVTVRCMSGAYSPVSLTQRHSRPIWKIRRHTSSCSSMRRNTALSNRHLLSGSIANCTETQNNGGAA